MSVDRNAAFNVLRRGFVMKRVPTAVLLAVFLIFSAGNALAVPTLQLYIPGGTYDTGTQTIIASSDDFDLFAYLVPETGGNIISDLDDTYYISAAVLTSTGGLVSSGGDLGSFEFDGNTIDVTGDMTYGVPPIELAGGDQGHDAGDLATHGVFPTYFSEFGFEFGTDQTAPFDTQEAALAGGTNPGDGPGTGMYYVSFPVDVSGLADGYVIHFDLYNTDLDLILALVVSDRDLEAGNAFAPFSHDAQSDGVVPEPGTLVLLGSGLVGLGILGRRRIAK